MKLAVWNIHKMTNNIQVGQFVIDTLKNTDADIICLTEYLTDKGITENLSDKYWFAESNTSSGNKVFIAVKKELASDGIRAINRNEESDCYNFLHVEFSMQNGEPLSVIGTRMLSPIDAPKQTPPLKRYLSKLSTSFLCAGDFNIWHHRMEKWFPGIPIEKTVKTDCPLSDSSMIYTLDSKVTGYGAVDHVLHSDNINVKSEYNWDFLSCDKTYPSVDKIIHDKPVWNIPPAYPDHALMLSEIEIKPYARKELSR